MVSRYMDAVEKPFIGYKMKPQYASLISDNPVGGGRLFRDPNGRPADNVLSALYLGCGPLWTQAQDACDRAEQYPGKFTYTDMDANYDPYYDEQ